MADQFDEGFYTRADAHIHLSNDQKNAQTPGATADMVNASMMFGSARFCAWLSAAGFESSASMAAGRQEIIDHFATGFRQMLEVHVDDYIKNFDAFMKPNK